MPGKTPRLTPAKVRVLQRVHARETYVGATAPELQTIASLKADRLVRLIRGDARFRYALTDKGRKAIGARTPRKPSDVRATVERLWAEKKTAAEIAEAVGWDTKNPSAVIATYRRRGWNLPPRQREKSANVRKALSAKKTAA